VASFPLDSNASDVNPRLATEGSADQAFIDDLVAADRFKSFLVGRGVDIPKDVLEGLAALSTVFADDIAEYHDEAGWSVPGFASVLKRTTEDEGTAASVKKDDNDPSETFTDNTGPPILR
jgi:hypothetical protein